MFFFFYLREVAYVCGPEVVPLVQHQLYSVRENIKYCIYLTYFYLAVL